MNTCPTLPRLHDREATAARMQIPWADPGPVSLAVRATSTGREGIVGRSPASRDPGRPSVPLPAASPGAGAAEDRRLLLPASWPLLSPERTPSRALSLETPVRPSPLGVVLLSSRAGRRMSGNRASVFRNSLPHSWCHAPRPGVLWQSSATWPPRGRHGSASFLGGSPGWGVELCVDVTRKD